MFAIESVCVCRRFADFLRWRFTAEPQPWPAYRELDDYDRPPAKVLGDQLRVAYVGHATVLIQTQGLNILTDPFWSQRTSPVSWAGPRRVHPPGILFDDLPVIDAVLISHSHYDHLDLATVRRLYLRDRPRIIVPLGVAQILRKKGVDAEEYDWGERVDLSVDMAVHSEPMLHWSARGWFDSIKGKSSYEGYGLVTYEDGSTTISKLQGNLTPIEGTKQRSGKGTGEYIKGTGRFEGIKGSFSYTGKQVTPYSKKEGTFSDSYYDVTATYTVPSK